MKAKTAFDLEFTRDWMNVIICKGDRVAVCTATVRGFPTGVVTAVDIGRVAVQLGGVDVRWFESKQVVVIEEGE